MGDDPRLAEFDAAVSRFHETANAFAWPLGQLRPEDHTLRAHASLTAYDVCACCNALRGRYLAIHDEMRVRLTEFAEDFAGWPQGENVADAEYDAFWAAYNERTEAERNTPEYLARLYLRKEEMRAEARGEGVAAAAGVVLKALLMFVRAHQDSLCALILLAHQPRGTANGRYSMASHLGDQRLVSAFVDKEVPGYVEWFRRWRDLRNRVKEGVNFTSWDNWDGMRLHFATIIPEGGGTRGGAEGIGLGEVVEALEMSASLHEAIKRRAEETLSRVNAELPAT